MTESAPDTVSVLFTLQAEAAPGMLPRLLQPFAKRDLVPDQVKSRRAGEVLLVELGMDAMPANELHLVEGNLSQVIGVRRLETMRRARLRSAA
ncbi:hypothetical protein [Sabulicella rubraurantiaca]|uniref:hypothetical protein n=1 Tax=Sabulicella rubraurantiaca TaxID=2811429 RepID=UPI001A966414|nr:hypothetical protein [Sabulicella rubraurantiaca]